MATKQHAENQHNSYYTNKTEPHQLQTEMKVFINNTKLKTMLK